MYILRYPIAFSINLLTSTSQDVYDQYQQSRRVKGELGSLLKAFPSLLMLRDPGGSDYIADLPRLRVLANKMLGEYHSYNEEFIQILCSPTMRMEMCNERTRPGPMVVVLSEFFLRNFLSRSPDELADMIAKVLDVLRKCDGAHRTGPGTTFPNTQDGRMPVPALDGIQNLLVFLCVLSKHCCATMDIDGCIQRLHESWTSTWSGWAESEGSIIETMILIIVGNLATTTRPQDWMENHVINSWISYLLERFEPRLAPDTIYWDMQALPRLLITMVRHSIRTHGKPMGSCDYWRTTFRTVYGDPVYEAK